MAKTKVVIFDHEGGWVLTNPKAEEYNLLPHVINPDLTAVQGLSPEKWALVAGCVVPATGIVNYPKLSRFKSFFIKIFNWIANLLGQINSI